jgi:hypothetical protein
MVIMKRRVVVSTRVFLFIFFLGIQHRSSWAMEHDAETPLLSALAPLSNNTPLPATLESNLHKAESLATLAQKNDSHPVQSPLEEDRAQYIEIEPASPSIRTIVTELAIAGLYLASSVPAVGARAQTITDLTASSLWTGDDLQELHDENKRTAAHGVDLGIAGLFLLGGIPVPDILKPASIGATFGASALWLGKSIHELFDRSKKLREKIVDVAVAGLFLTGCCPGIPKDMQDDANMAASAIWLIDSGIDFVQAVQKIRQLRAWRRAHAPKNIPTKAFAKEFAEDPA